jgi:hypothetical protein
MVWTAGNIHVSKAHSPVRRRMDVDEWTCFICLQVLTEPVTLPCGHEFCLDCLRDAIEKTSCFCPLCRHRLTCFIRTRRQGAGGEWRALINQERWTEIQRKEKLVPKRRKRRHSQTTSQSFAYEGRSREQETLLRYRCQSSAYLKQQDRLMMHKQIYYSSDD